MNRHYFNIDDEMLTEIVEVERARAARLCA
jgi:hypothetical protein